MLKRIRDMLAGIGYLAVILATLYYYPTLFKAG